MESAGAAKVASMYFFPQAWAAGAAGNLLCVALGNIFGVAGGVVLAYRFAYHGPGGG